MSRLSDAQIADVLARVDLAALAQRFGAVLRKSGRQMIGTCPLCGGGKKATRFAIKSDGQSWVCAVCSEGGDALALVQKIRGCDFRGAVEFLGGAAQLSREEEERLARKRKAENDRREKAAEQHRAQEIGRALRLWSDAALFPRDGVELYLRARGCGLPASADIRALRACAYFHGEVEGATGRKEPRVILRGPAMVAAIRDNAGAVTGCHLTHLLADFSGKAKILDPDSGEALPAKKMRGSKAGGHIVLRQPGLIERLFMGEGIETVLSVATALRRAGRLRSGDAFWSSGDLGNLGGRAVDTVKHPTLRSPAGRPQSVPGPQPDMDAPAIVIPDSVRELVLLGDGDSDAFTTQMTLQRGAARYARMGLHVRIAMAPAGMDFNDLLMNGVAA